MERTFICCDLCGTRVGEVVPAGTDNNIRHIKLLEWDNCTTVDVGGAEHYRCKKCNEERRR